MTPEFLEELKKQSPMLYTVALLSNRFLKEMEYGEIRMTMHVKNGKVWRIESYPVVSKMIET